MLAFLSSLNWGSVAEWFTGLLTAGTLLVAVTILLQDRRARERAGADAFATWKVRMGTHAVKGKANYTVEVNAFHAGDRPVPFAIAIPAPGGEELWPGTMISLKPIAPGEHVVQEIGLEEIWDATPLLIIFTDGRGRRWARSLRSNRYVTKRDVRRAYRRWGVKHPSSMLWDGTISAKRLAAARDAQLTKWRAEVVEVRTDQLGRAKRPRKRSQS